MEVAGHECFADLADVRIELRGVKSCCRGRGRPVRSEEQVIAIVYDRLHGIDVVDTIREMSAAGAGISNLKDEVVGQLLLDIQRILLDVATRRIIRSVS